MMKTIDLQHLLYHNDLIYGIEFGGQQYQMPFADQQRLQPQPDLYQVDFKYVQSCLSNVQSCLIK